LVSRTTQLFREEYFQRHDRVREEIERRYDDHLTMMVEPIGLALFIPKTNIRHDPQPVLSTSYFHNPLLFVILSLLGLSSHLSACFAISIVDSFCPSSFLVTFTPVICCSMDWKCLRSSVINRRAEH
jgi:hypothetical protein